jgi:hypothetical protein
MPTETTIDSTLVTMQPETLSPSGTSIPERPGSFEIDPADIVSRKGGALASLDAHDFTDDSTSALPLIVWLRGDEPFFANFNLTADQVMERLGIKRSRLTQLSGRELRVGRVRLDRYIRPVYREVDVEQYLQWTRATATHQKSTAALSTAIEELHQQRELVTQTLSTVEDRIFEKTEQQLETYLSSFTDQFFKRFADHFNETQTKTIAQLLDQGQSQLSRQLGESISQLATTTAETFAALQTETIALRAVLESMHLRLAHTEQALKDLQSLELSQIQLRQEFSHLKEAMQIAVSKHNHKNTSNRPARPRMRPHFSPNLGPSTAQLLSPCEHKAPTDTARRLRAQRRIKAHL